MLLPIKQCLLLLCLVSISWQGVAEPAQQNIPEDRIEVDKWQLSLALGYGAIENPLTKRDSAETFALPQFSYYGDRFYIDNINLGYSLFEGSRFYIDAFSYLNDDGLFYKADDTDLTFLDVRKFIPIRFPVIRVPFKEIERELSYMAGIKASVDLDWIELKLSAAQDISAGHDGHEIMFSIFDSYQFDNWRWYVELGVNYKSDKLVNYYYGFKPEEVWVPFPPVTEKWSANPFAKVALTYQLSTQLAAVVSLNHHWLHSDIHESLLVEKSHYFSGFAGINYQF